MNHRLNYKPALDGLRGLAVLCVMAFHAVPTTLPGGFLGVDIFFVLSGYLITSLLIMEFSQNKGINFLNFFARRWWRLAPALLAMLMLYGLTIWFFSPSATLDNEGLDTLVAALYLTNWTRAFALKESIDLGHTWSLAVEGQFYIVWPFLFAMLMRFIPRNNILLWSVISIALMSLSVRLYLQHHGASVARLYNGLDTRLETLMWGAALAVWLSGRAPKADTANLVAAKICRRDPWVWLSLLSIVALLTTAQWNSPIYYQAGITLVACFSALLIAYLVRQAPSNLGHFLSNPSLVWLGTISYGMYLWHFPIFKLFLSFEIEGWLLLAGGTLVTLPVAALSYYCLERPLLTERKSPTIAATI